MKNNKKGIYKPEGVPHAPSVEEMVSMAMFPVLEIPTMPSMTTYRT